MSNQQDQPKIEILSPVMLLGKQLTTGTVHLATTKGDPRCGQRRSTRYRLHTYEGGANTITCAACRRLAIKQLSK